jgi:hypothetical protein
MYIIEIILCLIIVGLIIYIFKMKEKVIFYKARYKFYKKEHQTLSNIFFKIEKDNLTVVGRK